MLTLLIDKFLINKFQVRSREGAKKFVAAWFFFLTIVEHLFANC